MVVGKLANDLVQCENKIDLELFFQDWWKNCDGPLFSLGGFLWVTVGSDWLRVFCGDVEQGGAD